jgi:hypothetical protein
MAAVLFDSIPLASANLVRALLIASASVPQEAEDLLEPLGGDKAILDLVVMGNHTWNLQEHLVENRIILYADTDIKYDCLDIYEVPIPEEFIKSEGLKTITTTLSFDPPVRHTRFDYLGVTMSFKLIRGKNPDEVREAFRKRNKNEDPIESISSSSFNCPMKPTPRIREGGTLQKGVYRTRKHLNTKYGENYYLVVRCEKKWANEDIYGKQRYAVVVTLEYSGLVDIYAKIKQRVQIPMRVRARA